MPQPLLPISQPPVSLLPPWAEVCSRCREQMGDGVPGLFLPASRSQPFAARWIWVLLGCARGMAASSQAAHGLAPMSWDTIMFWKFGNLSWQDPDHQELSLVKKTLNPPGGNPRGGAPCLPLPQPGPHTVCPPWEPAGVPTLHEDRL